MFARYGNAAYGILVLLLVLLLMKNLEDHPAGMKISRAPTLALSFAIATSVALTEYIIAEKYMNGILLDYKDGFLPAIKFLGDWVPTTVVRYRAIDNSYGWVPYLVSNPQVIVMVGFLVTFAMIRLIIKHFSDLDPIGVLASANPEMPDSETPMLKVSQSRDSKPKKSKPKQRAKPRNKSKYWSTKY
jgi:hypothetical protein